MSTEQAYITGFVKRANEHGLTETQAIELLKSAESSWLGRYLAADTVPSSILAKKGSAADAPVRQFGMTHNALANAQNQLDSGGDLSIMGEK